MRFFYLIAAYNESEVLPELVATLKEVTERFPGSKVCIVDNASIDGSQEVLRRLAATHSWLLAFFETRKGMGVAFRRGLIELRKCGLTREDWVAFNAADLPFGFSDLESFLKLQKLYPDVELFIGSKAHRDSQVGRSAKRLIASAIFKLIRTLFLGMKTGDPQGTLFLRGDALTLTEKIAADDYFFTTELVYNAEKNGEVVEMPVVSNAERRPSKVNLMKDGWKAIQQVVSLRQRS